MAQRGRERLRATHGRRPAVLAVLLLLLAAPAMAELSLETTTGLRVTIHTADDIREHWLDETNGRTWLRHPVAGEVELDGDRYPASQLQPVDPQAVAAAVESLRGFRTDLAVEIFLLPAFPAEVLASFARRESVFLAPALGEQAAETVAYLTTHELGHVLGWAAMDGRPPRWSAYRELRGLAEVADPGSLPHAERPREILAEDLRYLFGGPLATRSGTIENAALPLPDAVVGLEDLLAGFLADPNGGRIRQQPSRVYPNPCRDLAVVELDLDGLADKAAPASTLLEIYDLRGRLVRRLQQGRISGGRVAVSWDGCGEQGRRAAAGIYLYRIRHGELNGSGRLLLVAR